MTDGIGPAGSSGAGPGGRRRSRQHGGRAPRQGPRLAAGTMAGLIALAGGVLLLYPRQAPQHAQAAAADCGLVRCSASLPATGAASPAADATPTPARKRASAAPRPSATTATARRSATPGAPATPAEPVPPTRRPAPHPSPPAQPPGPPVTVGFAVDQTGGGWNGQSFTGHFTMVNHTAAAISGWTLQASLPGDRVRSVSTSGRGWPQYPDWRAAGDAVLISGPQPGEAIPAHGSIVLYLSGWGGGSSLGSCSFNGAPC